MTGPIHETRTIPSCLCFPEHGPAIILLQAAPPGRTVRPAMKENKCSARMTDFVMPLAAVALLMVFAAGCENDNGPDPVYADLRGNWTGYYEAPGRHEDLTANITQQGSNLVIETSLTGVGQNFTGIITSDGKIRLTDSYDGETWTSYGEVSSHYVRIRDYLFDPDLGADSPEQTIYLSR